MADTRKQDLLAIEQMKWHLERVGETEERAQELAEETEETLSEKLKSL